MEKSCIFAAELTKITCYGNENQQSVSCCRLYIQLSLWLNERL